MMAYEFWSLQHNDLFCVKFMTPSKELLYYFYTSNKSSLLFV